MATGANSDKMSVKNPNVNTQQSIKSKFHKKIAIGEVTGGSKTNPLWASQVDNKDLKVALEKSLAVFAYTQVNDAPEYRLDTQLVRLQQPLIGISFLVKSTIRYSIVDLKTNETVFNKTIDSQHTAKLGDMV